MVPAQYRSVRLLLCSLAGAIAGALLLGLVLPFLGLLIGPFIGIFAVYLYFGMKQEQDSQSAFRLAFAALTGRLVGSFIKMSAGLIMTIWLITDLIAIKNTGAS